MGKKTKTEHAGAKNGGGFWGKREEAKQVSRERRRQLDKEIERNAELYGRLADEQKTPRKKKRNRNEKARLEGEIKKVKQFLDSKIYMGKTWESFHSSWRNELKKLEKKLSEINDES